MQGHAGIGVAEHLRDVLDGDTTFVADGRCVRPTGCMSRKMFLDFAQLRDFLQIAD